MSLVDETPRNRLQNTLPDFRSLRGIFGIMPFHAQFPIRPRLDLGPDALRRENQFFFSAAISRAWRKETWRLSIQGRDHYLAWGMPHKKLPKGRAGFRQSAIVPQSVSTQEPPFCFTPH